MKRTLALVLALVMVIGMMAVPASADFKDAAKIQYTEAVDVVAAAGIINGFEDGSFDPAGTLTREQAAKLIAYIDLGAKKADALKATEAPFADVAADRWSAGYIAYCVEAGYLAGVGEGNFAPTAALTGYAYAKLLLGSLGYDAAVEGYTGAGWAVNVAQDALDIDLFDGNDDADYNEPATREEAALYTLNALKAVMVEYDQKGTNIDLGNGITINTGATKAEKVTAADGKANKIDDENVTVDGVEGCDYVQLGEKRFTKLEKTSTDADAFGRPAAEWKYDGDKVGTYADEPEVTYTVATKGSAIYADLGKPDADKATYTYFIDGKEVDADDVKADFAIAKGDAGSVKAGDNGVLIEVYEPTDDNFVVVIINTYVGVIDTWVEADDDEDIDEGVTIDSKNDIDLYDDSFDTTAFSEDDEDDETVVLFTAAWDEDEEAYAVKSVVAAEKVTAEVEKVVGTSSFTAGGETYKYSANKIATVGTATVDDGNDYDFYFDSYGYMIYTEATEEAAAEYAYVIDLGEDGMYADSKSYYAKIVTADGKVSSVELDKEYKNVKGTIVEYKVNSDDEYKLAVADDITEGEISKLTKGLATIKLGEKKSVKANAKTVFVVAETDNDGDTTYTAYTGIANVPSFSEGAVIAAKADGKTYEQFVFIDNPTEAESTSSDDTIVVLKDKDDFADVITVADTDAYVVLPAIVKGEIQSIDVKVDSAAYEKLAEVEDDGLLIVKSMTTKSGQVTGFGTVIEATKAAAGTKALEDGVLTLGADELSVADDCVVYTYEDGAFEASKVSEIGKDKNDVATYTLDDDGFVDAIYIKIVD